jgi:hypothetical protein
MVPATADAPAAQRATAPVRASQDVFMAQGLLDSRMAADRPPKQIWRHPAAQPISGGISRPKKNHPAVMAMAL